MEFQKELFRVRPKICSLVHIVGNEMESQESVCLTSGDIDTSEGKKKVQNLSGTEMISYASSIR